MLEWDADMYGDRPFKAFNFTIHEDIGSINYVFTDKTGTLTQNQLTFKGCSIQGKIYEDSAGSLFKNLK